MSQSRQEVKDRRGAAYDYEVNLNAELEILSRHEKIDELREMKWADDSGDVSECRVWRWAKLVQEKTWMLTHS